MATSSRRLRATRAWVDTAVHLDDQLQPGRLWASSPHGALLQLPTPPAPRARLRVQWPAIGLEVDPVGELEVEWSAESDSPRSTPLVGVRWTHLSAASPEGAVLLLRAVLNLPRRPLEVFGDGDEVRYGWTPRGNRDRHSISPPTPPMPMGRSHRYSATAVFLPARLGAALGSSCAFIVRLSRAYAAIMLPEHTNLPPGELFVETTVCRDGALLPLGIWIDRLKSPAEDGHQPTPWVRGAIRGVEEFGEDGLFDDVLRGLSSSSTGTSDLRPYTKGS